MMMDKIKKKSLTLCLIIINLVLNIQYCYAAGVSVIDSNALTGGIPGQATEPQFSEWAPYEPSTGNKKYQYRYKSNLSISTDVAINAYDLEGNSIIPYSTYIDPTKNSFKAGTWIGINTTEIKSAAWSLLDFEAEEIKKRYKCTYTKPGGTKKCSKTTTTWTTQSDCDSKGGKFTYCGGNGTCEYCVAYSYSSATPKTYISDEVEYNEEYTCPTTHPEDSSYKNPIKEEYDEPTEEVTTGTVVTEIKNTIISRLHSTAVSSVASSSGIVRYKKDPNDIENIEPATLNGKTSYYHDSYSQGDESGTVRKDFEFFPSKVCINLKTSKISYRTDECKTTDGEIEIKRGTTYERTLGKEVSYWHYFIPLNSKSDSKFTIDIIKNGNETYNANQCASFMKTFATDSNKKNDDYRNYIIPADNTKVFVGDYNEKGTRSEDWKILTKGEPAGCQISMTVEFPVEQKFYNETEDKTFKGFNFYYKPIDVNNPFPNGIPSNSIWKETDTEKLTGTSLNKDDITYIANVSNTKEIRNYTKDNPYTSWENMYLDGRSGFIENEGFVTRYIKNTDFYKLGCGPSNSKATNSDGTKNYLYQQECGT